LNVAVLVVASVAAATLAGSRAAATTLPETTYFYNITLTNTQVMIMPRMSVKPGSLVVFTVRNTSSQPRSLIFGAYKTGFIGAGGKKEFELNFIVPWSFVAISAETGGGHKLTARFVCSW
jgi:hypothetical protein